MLISPIKVARHVNSICLIAIITIGEFKRLRLCRLKPQSEKREHWSLLILCRPKLYAELCERISNGRLEYMHMALASAHSQMMVMIMMVVVAVVVVVAAATAAQVLASFFLFT